MVEHSAVNRVVVGSSPTRGVSCEGRVLRSERALEKAWSQGKEPGKEKRLRGQAVKTSPFHGGNTGSIPVGVIYHSDNRSIVAKRMIKLCILFYYV